MEIGRLQKKVYISALVGRGLHEAIVIPLGRGVFSNHLARSDSFQKLVWNCI